MTDIFQDLRFGTRMLLKTPGFTLIALLTLALGIGASTALYSVVNTVLLNPLPGPTPQKLVCVDQSVLDGSARKTFNLTPAALEVLLNSQGAFSDLAWWRFVDLERKTDQGIEDISGATVAPNFFRVWGINPALGHTFAMDETTIPNEEGIPATDGAIVLSHSLWRSVYAGDAGVLGKDIELSGHHFRVIGVMPDYFRFPLGNYAKFWIASQPMRHHLGWAPDADIRVIARLGPRFTLKQAQSILDVAGSHLGPEAVPSKLYVVGSEWNPSKRLGFSLRPLSSEFRDDELERALFSFLGAVGFFLLISCANIANLTLARTKQRERELAIRAALGAGEARIMRQILTETLLLVTLGAALGVCLTPGFTKAIASLVPQDLPRLKEMQVDGHALGFTLLICLTTALVCGTGPARQAVVNRFSDTLRLAGNRASAPKAGRSYRSKLVIVEVALTLVLMAGAGLMIQSVFRLLRVDPGMDPKNLMFIKVWLPWERYEYQAGANRSRPSTSNQTCDTIFSDIHDRLAALPGITGISFMRTMGGGDFRVDTQSAPISLVCVGCGVGSRDLFKVMRLPLLAGRYLSQSDGSDGQPGVVVNETMARRCWPGQDPLNQQFRSASSSNDSAVYRVAGVVRDYRDRYDQKTEPTFFVPYGESPHWTRPRYFQALVVRTSEDPARLIPSIRKELQAAEPTMRAPMFIPATRALKESSAVQRSYMVCLMAFAAAALLVSTIGLYGTLAYSVAQRTPEIGIRMALGAERRTVLALVLAEGARMIAGGVAVGLLAAFWLTRLLRNQLFQVSPTDPLVLGLAVVMLAAVAVLACLVPAVRATRVNPIQALRDP